MLQGAAPVSEVQGADFSEEQQGGLLPNTMAHIHGVEQALNYPPTAPVMSVLIEGMYTLLDDTQAESAFEETLDRMLEYSKNKQLLELVAYVLESLNIALEKPEVREVIKKKLSITNEVFTKNEAKAFVTQGIQTSYRVLTDYGVLRSVRQSILAGVKVLTDPLYQQRIAKYLRSMIAILMDPEALSYVEVTLKAVNRILSSENARSVISSTAQTLKMTAGKLSANNARRIGKMQSRLAQPSSGLSTLGGVFN